MRTLFFINIIFSLPLLWIIWWKEDVFSGSYPIADISLYYYLIGILIIFNFLFWKGDYFKRRKFAIFAIGLFPIILFLLPLADLLVGSLEAEYSFQESLNYTKQDFPYLFMLFLIGTFIAAIIDFGVFKFKLVYSFLDKAIKVLVMFSPIIFFLAGSYLLLGILAY